jgi:hypothetical protein
MLIQKLQSLDYQPDSQAIFFEDDKSDRGKRSSMFVDAKFEYGK